MALYVILGFGIGIVVGAFISSPHKVYQIGRRAGLVEARGIVEYELKGTIRTLSLAYAREIVRIAFTSVLNALNARIGYKQPSGSVKMETGIQGGAEGKPGLR